MGVQMDELNVNMTMADAILQRHSIRKYSEQLLPDAAVNCLRQETEVLNASHGLHIQLVCNEPLAFRGLNSYGVFHGVRYYWVVVGRKGLRQDELLGYCGERLVLLARRLGLGSCWVGLTHGKVSSAFRLEKDESVRAMIAVGYAAEEGRQPRKKTFADLARYPSSMDVTALPVWFVNGVKAAALAPSALNQQKYSFEYIPPRPGEKPCVKARKGFSLFGYTALDLGIARLHFEIGAGNAPFEWV